MIPVRLQIKGFLSYYDPVDVSFESFDMACIAGSNGAGKSSLLDAITWVLFGEARRRDDTIINHRTQKENKPAEVTLDFEYERSRYRVLRTKQKDKNATLDFFILTEDETWKPLTEATMRATQESIRRTLKLDYETFINASFFLQGKADQFAQQKPADRKRILASILGLEIWNQYKEEAANRRKQAERDRDILDGALKDIETELAEEETRKEKLKTLTAEYERRKELAEARKTVLDQQKLLADRFEHEKTAVEKQAIEVQRLNAALDQKVDDLRGRQEERKQFKLQLENEKSIRAEHEVWTNARQRLNELEALAANSRQFDARRHDALIKIEAEKSAIQVELDALLKKQSEIRLVEKSLPALQSEVLACETLIGADLKQLELRPTLEREMQELQAEKARAKAENLVLKPEMDELESKRKVLRELTEANCPTCEKPLNADERKRIIDDLTSRGTPKGEAYRQNLKIIEQNDDLFREKQTALAALQTVEADLKLQQRVFDAKSAELKRQSAELDNWQATGLKRLEALQKSYENQDYAPEARISLAKIDEELKGLGYDPGEHETIRSQEEDSRESQQKISLLEQAKSALVPLEREIATLEKTIEVEEAHLETLKKEYRDAQSRLIEMEGAPEDLARIEREYFAAQSEANNLLTEVGSARNQVAVLNNQRAQQAVKQEEKQGVLREIANLKTLERAFGKDGIPALLIEQALPEIEEHANEILDRLSSGEMSLRFETQREYKDAKRDDRKETLDIMISSSAEEREYELFSGGEAFRINFAVRLALSRVLANRAGARMQTLVIDEGFGSQDSEGRQRLIEAINFVKPEFARILVITHLEELKDAFSARIEVTKQPNGSQVQVVAA
jgi:exonuclease SbcC